MFDELLQSLLSRLVCVFRGLDRSSFRLYKSRPAEPFLLGRKAFRLGESCAVFVWFLFFNSQKSREIGRLPSTTTPTAN